MTHHVGVCVKRTLHHLPIDWFCKRNHKRSSALRSAELQVLSQLSNLQGLGSSMQWILPATSLMEARYARSTPFEYFIPPPPTKREIKIKEKEAAEWKNEGNPAPRDKCLTCALTDKPLKYFSTKLVTRISASKIIFTILWLLWLA